MFRALKRSALLMPTAVAAVVVALAATPSSIALASGASGPVWGTATALTPSPLSAGLFDSAACTSSGTCMVAGDAKTGSTTSVPAVVAESGGAWGAASTTTITGASTNEGGYISVSCMSDNSCFGVGFNTDSSATRPFTGPITVSGTDAMAGPATTLPLPSTPTPFSPELAGLSSVSCAPAGCTAVGAYKTSGGDEQPIVATTSGSGSWNVATVPPPAVAVGNGGAVLTAVSCPSSGACEAVGNYKNASGDVLSWAVQLGGAETAQTLTAPAGAVDAVGTLPPVAEPLNLSGGQMMDAISCPAAGGACTAVGAYPTGSGGSIDPMAFSISNGTPSTGIPLPPASGLALTSVLGLWCSDANNCTADGDILTAGGSGFLLTPMSGYETSGTWSTFTALPGASPTASTMSYVMGLGCINLGTCVAAGLQGDSALSSFAPMVDFSAPPLSVTTSSLPAAVAGVPYSATLQGTGGAGTPSWTITGSLPAGLSLNAATGVISGTPTVPGSSSFTVQLASAGPPAQTASASLSITVAAVPKLSAGAPKVTPNGVTLPIGCSGSGSCSGTAVVTAVEHFSGKRPTAVTAHVKRRTVKLTLARGSYSLTAGQLGRVTLKLTAKAKTLLARLHKISGRLTLTPTGASKPSITRTVVFKSVARKKK